MVWKWFIPLYLASCITYCESAYRSRYRSSYSDSVDEGFIAGIVVACVVLMSIPITFCICIKCGLCKPRGSVGAGGVLQSNTLQTTVIPPQGQQYGQSGQQYGQSGVSSFGQTQYGAPPSYGQSVQYGQQQNGFGQPVENQFSYGRP